MKLKLSCHDYQNHVQRKGGEAYSLMNTVPTVKFGDWQCNAFGMFFCKISIIHIYQPLLSLKVNFKRSLTGLNSEFPFSKTSCLTKAKEPSMPDYLPKAEGRTTGFIHLPRVLVVWEMQSVSSRIWTRVAEFISFDDNHYTTGTSNLMPFIYFH